MRMRYENGAQTGCDRGIDVRARTVPNHKSQRRIEVRVAHQAAIGVDVLLARGLDAIEERTETGTRELVQLFVALALGENQEAVTLRKLRKQIGRASCRERV